MGSSVKVGIIFRSRRARVWRDGLKIESGKAIQHIMLFPIILKVVYVIDCSVTWILFNVFARNSISKLRNEIINDFINMSEDTGNDFECFRAFVGNLIAVVPKIESSAFVHLIRPNTDSKSLCGVEAHRGLF
jgi:hypothetical protein